jgi:hypothetical protein
MGNKRGTHVTSQWLLRVESGLAAHFKVPNEPSRPGVHWAVVLENGEQTYTVRVKALFAADATRKTQKNQTYQAQVAMQYLNDQLNEGWHPSQEVEHTIYVSNPTGASDAPSTKAWWRFW